MKTLAFVSRHAPTPAQHALAREAGLDLIHVGDRDAFAPVEPHLIENYDGAVVVHPAAAVAWLATGKLVGVFENETRPPVGGVPQFDTRRLVVYAVPEDMPADPGYAFSLIRVEYQANQSTK